MADLAIYPLGVIFAISAVVTLAAGEIGRRFGARAGDRGWDNVSTLEAAILGLLALMISFTFAMALQRFDARRDAVLQEANAIGTTALRARLLPPPHRMECLKLLREYVQVRLDITRREPSAAEMAAAIQRSNQIQEALWQQAKAVAAKDNAMVPTGVFIQTLNDMIDAQETRLTALRTRVPSIVLIALYGIAITAIGFAGFSDGLEKSGSRLPVFLTALLVAAVILLIQDLDRPGAGYVTVSQQPMVDTAESLAGYQE